MADNDFSVVRMVKKIIKSCIFSCSFLGKPICSEKEGNLLLRDLIENGEPFMVARFGAVEARCLSKWLSHSSYTVYNINSIKEAAGVFPNDIETINKFCDIYCSSIRQIDHLAVWGVVNERKLVDLYCPKAKLIHINSLEPYFFNQPWSKALENKKLLIIHPFVETIEKQLTENQNMLFKSPDILPRFKKISYIKAVQSNADANTEFANWFEGLDNMKKQIQKQDFDIALIGAGAYGLPLASFVKVIGKQAVQMAGATQILFGIKGKRWDSRAKYKKLFNEYWTRPNLRETPEGLEKVEGGSYW